MWLWLALACGDGGGAGQPTPGGVIIETADTGCTPRGYSCVDVVDADGACAPDGVVDFDPALLPVLTLGVVVDGGCDHTPGEIPIVFGPAGGWTVEVCFSVTDTPAEVWVVPAVSVLPTGEDIAGSEATDWQAVRLDDWSEGTCEGSTTARAQIDDDPEWRGSPPPEAVCGWRGQEVRVALSVDAADRVGNAWWIAPATLVDASTGEAYDCP
ncbi:MAG: hypothetical protein ACI8PZ_001393 [Myxococcota bacterium]|jgi:hypothetical protein